MKSRESIPGERSRCALCSIEGPAYPETGGASNFLRTSRNCRPGLWLKICPDCAENEDRESIKVEKVETIFGYLSISGGKVQARQSCGLDQHPGTSFDGVHGRTLGRVVSVGKEVPRTRFGPFGVRHYVNVQTFDGTLWHGTGAPGMWCRLKRSKQQ